jgi:hypothetical protein
MYGGDVVFRSRSTTSFPYRPSKRPIPMQMTYQMPEVLAVEELTLKLRSLISDRPKYNRRDQP